MAKVKGSVADLLYESLNGPNDIPDRGDIVGNTKQGFRDGFNSAVSTVPDPTVWNVSNNDNQLLTAGGNSFGSSYLRISMDPLLTNSEVILTSKDTFDLPVKVGFGVSLSQRIIGQEVFCGFVGVDDNNVEEFQTIIPDVAISGATISILTNVATVTHANHGFVGGDRIVIYGCAEHRLSVGPVVVTVLTKNTFTVPCTLADGSYSSVGGYINYAHPVKQAKNGLGFLYDNATVTNASLVSQGNGDKFRSVVQTTATSVAVQSNASPYTDAFNAAAVNELYASLDEVAFRSITADGVSAPSGLTKYTQAIPDTSKKYALQIRVRNHSNLTTPICRISTIAKTGTTTATVTTDAPHGLATNDWVQIWGVIDQVNYPNLAASAIVTVTDATHFTVIIGTATTTNSTDGFVVKNRGSVLMPGTFTTNAIVNIQRTNNVLNVTGSANWTTPLPGEFVQLYGLVSNGSTAYEGAYKVLRVSTTILELESVGADTPLIWCGGAAFRRTDVRLHFVRAMNYTRLVAEIQGGRGNTTDINNAVPVTIASGTQAVSGSLTTAGTVTQSTGLVTAQWNAAGFGGLLVNDVPSAAITTTATTAAFTPGILADIGSYSCSFNIIVTASAGTLPTLDVGVEESTDNGTTWVRIYDFPRFITTGNFTSPRIRSQWGTRFRYVQTVSGSAGQSFTRAINRVQFSSDGTNFRAFVDRSAVITTLNAVTPSYLIEGCTKIQLIVNVGVITTTAPIFQLEGSEDGTTWYLIGTTLTAVTSATVAGAIVDTAAKFIRARVSTAGVSVVAGYVSIKAFGA